MNESELLATFFKERPDHGLRQVWKNERNLRGSFLVAPKFLELLS